MKVHVTGGSGFLGGHVIPLLVGQGHDVTALARSDDAAAAVAELGAVPIEGDLDDPASVTQAFRDADAEVLANLASLGFGHAPAIVDAAEAAGIGRAVFVSTTAIHTRLDASSKPVRVAAEERIRASALDWTILRPTMIYGAPGDRNMWRLLQLTARSPAVPVPGHGHLHQPVHVADLAAAVVGALVSDVAIGHTYDIAGPDPITLEEIVRRAGEAGPRGRAPRVVRVPTAAVLFVFKVLERLPLRLPLSSEQVARLTEDKAFDIADATADLGFAPRSFDDGIRAEAAMEAP